MFCSNCGERIDADSYFCVHCGHKVAQTGSFQNQTPHVRTGYSKQSSENGVFSADAKSPDRTTENNANFNNTNSPNQINETTVYNDMITYVGNNTSYYDQKWRIMDQLNKKSSWNFAAFFLSIFWLGYRRLWKEMFTVIASLFVIEVAFIFLDQEFILLQYVNYVIGIIVAVGLGLYGNYLYRRNAEKKVHLLRNIAESQVEKEALLQENGGTSTGGVFGAIGLFIVYFGIMSYLLFSVFGVVTLVKNGTLYEYPDITVGEAFNDFFDEGKWKKQRTNASFQLVEFTGNKTIEGEKHDMKVYFIVDNDDEFQFNRIVVDGEELDDYDFAMFIDFMFDDAEGLEYW